MKQACHCEENNCQFLLLMIKISALKSKLKFWKMCNHNPEFYSFPVLKKFSDGILRLHVWFCDILKNRSVNTWKIYTTHWTSYFPDDQMWAVTKIIHGWKIQSRYKINQWTINNTYNDLEKSSQNTFSTISFHEAKYSPNKFTWPKKKKKIILLSKAVFRLREARLANKK